MLHSAADPAAIESAARQLAAGGLVAFPTETVYGLGSHADDDAAVAKIFAAKGRPADHPLIVHVADVAAARFFAASLPPLAVRLIEHFWPGPLTLIVPRAAGRAQAAASGALTVGLRAPSHPAARRLLGAAARHGVAGVAAPSANRFGRLSPTEAAHVAAEFGPTLAVLDGGPCVLGIESAIVDCSRGRPVLLRPGTLTRAEIERVAGEPLAERDAAAPRAPGTLDAHYAPRAALRLVPADTLRAWLDGGPWPDTPGQGPALGDGAAVYSRTVRAAPSTVRPPWRLLRVMPDDAALAAHELFAVLRELDAAGVDLICVETPPDTLVWEGVRDRLRRAAAA